MSNLNIPVAKNVKTKARHWFVSITFIFSVLVPTSFAGWYLYNIAANQYISKLSFSVRSEELGSSPLQLLGMPQLSGSAASDTDILYEYLQSQKMVELVGTKINLRKVYSKPNSDFVFALKSQVSIEELVKYWNRMVKVYHDTRTGLISIRVHAFDPIDARAIALEIQKHSTLLLNQLSLAAREDATQFARSEVSKSVQRLSEARSALTRFRNETQIVDPAADIQGQVGLVTTLQQQLAEALIEHDLLKDVTNESDPRLIQAQKRIEVIQNRINDERLKLGISGGNDDESAFATLIGQFESLAVEREFAEQSYLSALATLDKALAEAQRQSRYLAVHITPTLAETATYPQRLMLLSLITIFGFLFWALTTLIYYSARDRN